MTLHVPRGAYQPRLRISGNSHKQSCRTCTPQRCAPRRYATTAPRARPDLTLALALTGSVSGFSSSSDCLWLQLKAPRAYNAVRPTAPRANRHRAYYHRAASSTVNTTHQQTVVTAQRYDGFVPHPTHAYTSPTQNIGRISGST